MVDFVLRLADLTVAVRAMHDRMIHQGVEYLLPSNGFEADAGHADIAVHTTQRDIDHERAIGEPGNWDDAYLETLAIFRAIAEKLPAWNRVVFHGATIAYRGRALIFTAPSGTGKTTHIRLWKHVYGDDVDIINGDKPILRVSDGGVTAYGTPWAGKEHWQRNTSAPVAGICVVTRATAASSTGGTSAPEAATASFPDEHGIINTCERLEAAEALPLLLSQIYMSADPLAVGQTLDLLDMLLRNVPVYRLVCTISDAAVQASAEAMLPSLH